MISAFLFDLDGTLFDQYDANRAAYEMTFADVGLPFDKKLYARAYGLRFEEFMAVMAPRADVALYTKIKQLKVIHYPKHFHLVRPNQGLIELLGSLHEQFATALVTTARKKNATNLLKHFGLGPELFTVVVTGEDVKHSKPDPECYNIALTKLRKKAHEVLVFEDTDIGVEAATRAGAHVVRVVI